MATKLDRPCVVWSLDNLPYLQALDLQRRLVTARAQGHDTRDQLLFAEHPPVLTMGKHVREPNLLVDEQFLQQKGLSVHRADRGGDITYHGPGQWVAYPIIHLGQSHLSVPAFVGKLEEVMKETAFSFGIHAVAHQRGPGIWIGSRKVGSVGIAIRRSVTFHGLALNVNSKCLMPFQWIVPCGLQGITMASLSQAAGRPLKMRQVKAAMEKAFVNVFGWRLIQAAIPKEGEGTVHAIS